MLAAIKLPRNVNVPLSSTGISLNCGLAGNPARARLRHAQSFWSQTSPREC